MGWDDVMTQGWLVGRSSTLSVGFRGGLGPARACAVRVAAAAPELAFGRVAFAHRLIALGALGTVGPGARLDTRRVHLFFDAAADHAVAFQALELADQKARGALDQYNQGIRRANVVAVREGASMIETNAL